MWLFKKEHPPCSNSCLCPFDLKSDSRLLISTIRPDYKSVWQKKSLVLNSISTVSPQQHYTQLLRHKQCSLKLKPRAVEPQQNNNNNKKLKPSCLSRDFFPLWPIAASANRQDQQKRQRSPLRNPSGELRLTAQNSSKDILPSPSLSAFIMVLSTICWSCVSFKLLPTIIFSTWKSSPLEM